MLCRFSIVFLGAPSVRTLTAHACTPFVPFQGRQKSVRGKLRLSSLHWVFGRACMAQSQLPPAPVLQRDLFEETLNLKALRIPKKECHVYMKLLKGWVPDASLLGLRQLSILVPVADDL